VKELVALAQSRPKGLSFGSAGVGTPLHFAAEMVRSATKANFVHVPYKGSGGIAPALLGDTSTLAVTGTNSVLPGIRSGKLRALATMSMKRSSALPDVPTIAEHCQFRASRWKPGSAPWFPRARRKRSSPGSALR